MKILMIVLALLGMIILGIGIIEYVQSLNSGDVGTVLFGSIFSAVLIVIGGGLLVIDLIILLIYALMKRKRAVS